MRQLVQTVRNLVGLDDVATQQTQQAQQTHQGEAAQNHQTKWRVRIGTGAVIVVALVCLAVAVIVSFIANSLAAQPATTVVALHSTKSPSTSSTSSATRGITHASGVSAAAYDDTEIIVHIVGAVATPGIYWLRSGARVMDVTSAAGGLTPNAQICAINLARVVNDGEQIVIPDTTQTQCALEGSQSSNAQVAGAGQAGALVNINTATVDQLDSLPGIGPAIAARIVQWRSEHGMFSSADQLTDVPGIGDVLMAKLVNLVSL